MAKIHAIRRGTWGEFFRGELGPACGTKAGVFVSFKGNEVTCRHPACVKAAKEAKEKK